MDDIPVDLWEVKDVENWLNRQKLGQYKAKFAEELITGQDLLELTEADLLELGVIAVGHRKLFLRYISKLAKESTLDDDVECRSFSSHTSRESLDSKGSFGSRDSSRSGRSNYSGKSTGSQPGPVDRIPCVCRYRSDVRMILIKPKTSLKRLLWKIEDEYNRKLSVYWEVDGDKIKIASDRQLRTAIKMLDGSSTQKLYLTLRKRSKRGASRSKSRSKSSSRTSHADLDASTDASVRIESGGYIKYLNAPAERMFGYTKEQAIGKNVAILMPGIYAARHDQYLRDYLKTGQQRIIGNSRVVLGLHQDGHTFGVELTVSESKTRSHHYFTGVFRPMKKNPAGAGRFEVLDGLLEAVVCMNEYSAIVHANPRAREFFGYTYEQMVGSDISVLMPSPHKENHCHYMQSFLSTGVSSIMGKMRPTVCQLADGQIRPINLSVCEASAPGSGRQFIATISARTKSARPVSFLQKQRQSIELLSTAAVIIDESSVIQGFNKAASKLLGYSLEKVLGQNVRMIVGTEHAAQHEAYVRAYLHSGVPKIIGRERTVFALHSSRSEIKVLLSVTEQVEDSKRLFVGLLFPIAQQAS